MRRPDPEPPDGSDSARRAFIRGLTQPSAGALALTLALPLVALGLCMALITPALLASEAHRYFARDGSDGDLFLTARLAAVSRVTPRRPVVVVLGGSAVTEAITSSASLRRVVATSSGAEPSVWNLASWGQSLEGSLSIVERLPERFEGVVLLGLTPSSMALGPGVRPGMLAEARELGDPGSLGMAFERESGNYFWANRHFFLPRMTHLARNLANGPVSPDVHPFLRRKRPMPPGVFDDVAPRLRERIETDYETNVAACLRTIEAIIAELKERGAVEVVLFESPLSPRATAEVYGEAFLDRHRSRLAAFARANDAHYWNPQREAALAQEDFYDLNHLYRWPAMRRFTRVLGLRTGDLLDAGEGGR